AAEGPSVVELPRLKDARPEGVARLRGILKAAGGAAVALLRQNADGCRTIRGLAVPDLCTGVGGMPATEAVARMRGAYDNVVGGNGIRSSIRPWPRTRCATDAMRGAAAAAAESAALSRGPYGHTRPAGRPGSAARPGPRTSSLGRWQWHDPFSS